MRRCVHSSEIAEICGFTAMDCGSFTKFGGQLRGQMNKTRLKRGISRKTLPVTKITGDMSSFAGYEHCFAGLLPSFADPCRIWAVNTNERGIN